jgi:hypothetical protein
MTIPLTRSLGLGYTLLSRRDAECGTRSREGRQAHVDAERRQGDEKAQQQGEGHGGGRYTHQSQPLWLADRCQRHLNARRSAIGVEHPGRILQAF